MITLAGVTAAFAGGAQEEAAAGTGADRDTLTIAMGAEPESLDPVRMTSAPAATVSEHVVQRLINMEEDGSLAPMLATSWESSE
jgi:peptide/nickel transport system substrate-binding protein